MTTTVFTNLALARRRAARIAAVAIAASRAALASAGADAGAYNFETINDPAQPPFMGTTFTNLMGVTSDGKTIAGFYGSGADGDPNTGFVLTLPAKTFMPENFPPPFVQSQITAVNGNGTTFTGYTYPTNLGVQFDFQFGFYEKGGVFAMVNNPKTPDCSVSGACDKGVITENQLIGVNNGDLAVGFYNDRHGDSHGYTYDIATKTFSADINDPLAVSTVTAAINNSGEIAGFYTDMTTGAIQGFIKDGSVFTTVSAPGAAETELLGINDKGLAVGFDCIVAGCAGGAMHGVIYNIATNTFTPLDPPGSMGTTLNGLNDNGQIVGFFVDAKGNTDGLLASPIPELTTWVMMLAGFASLGWLGLLGAHKREAAR